MTDPAIARIAGELTGVYFRGRALHVVAVRAIIALSRGDSPPDESLSVMRDLLTDLWAHHDALLDALGELREGSLHDASRPVIDRWPTRLRRRLLDVMGWLSPARSDGAVDVPQFVELLADGRMPADWGDALASLHDYHRDLKSVHDAAQSLAGEPTHDQASAAAARATRDCLGLCINADNRTVERNGTTVDFGARDKPWRIFLRLAQAKGVKVSAETLMADIWRLNEIVEPQAVKRQVSELRAILRPLGLRIASERAVGYWLTDSSTSQRKRKKTKRK